MSIKQGFKILIRLTFKIFINFIKLDSFIKSLREWGYFNNMTF